MENSVKCEICGEVVGTTDSGFKPYWCYFGDKIEPYKRVCRKCWGNNCPSLFSTLDL